MPTYEYECRTCGHRFEEFQSIKADPLTACPQTGCPGPVKRLISTGAGLLFKGSGFYITDYRSDGYQKAAKAEKDGGSSSAPAKSGDAGSAPAKSDSTAKAPAKD